jgi:hypothetical protein
MLDWAGRTEWLQTFGGETSWEVATWKSHDNIKMDLRDRIVEVRTQIGFSINDVEPSRFSPRMLIIIYTWMNFSGIQSGDRKWKEIVPYKLFYYWLAKVQVLYGFA